MHGNLVATRHRKTSISHDENLTMFDTKKQNLKKQTCFGHVNQLNENNMLIFCPTECTTSMRHPRKLLDTSQVRRRTFFEPRNPGRTQTFPNASWTSRLTTGYILDVFAFDLDFVVSKCFLVDAVERPYHADVYFRTTITAVPKYFQILNTRDTQRTTRWLNF